MVRFTGDSAAWQLKSIYVGLIYWAINYILRVRSDGDNRYFFF